MKQGTGPVMCGTRRTDPADPCAGVLFRAFRRLNNPQKRPEYFPGKTSPDHKTKPSGTVTAETRALRTNSRPSDFRGPFTTKNATGIHTAMAGLGKIS